MVATDVLSALEELQLAKEQLWRERLRSALMYADEASCAVLRIADGRGAEHLELVCVQMNDGRTLTERSDSGARLGRPPGNDGWAGRESVGELADRLRSVSRRHADLGHLTVPGPRREHLTVPICDEFAAAERERARRDEIDQRCVQAAVLAMRAELGREALQRVDVELAGGSPAPVACGTSPDAQIRPLKSLCEFILGHGLHVGLQATRICVTAEGVAVTRAPRS